MYSQAIQKGDQKAFEKLFKAFYGPLCHYAFKVLKDADESEEIVQEVFHRVWEKRSEINVQISIKSYLYKSVYNQALNRIKHEKIKDSYKVYNAEQIRQNPDSALNLTLTNELQSRVDEAIGNLAPQCQKIFRMSRNQGLKYAEIAQELNISIKTVENQMGKALKIMRERLADYLSLLVLLAYSAYVYETILFGI